MSDNDMIRRGDALAIVVRDRVPTNRTGSEFRVVSTQDMLKAIAALPAVTVGAMIAKVPTRYQTVNGDRLLHEGDLLAAQEYEAVDAGECMPAVDVSPLTSAAAVAMKAREAALREALDCCTDYGFTRANECRDAILALIQKGGDAYAVDPRHAPHEASPGVTAGADAAHARETALQELIDAYEDIMDYGIVFAKKDQQDRLKAAKEKLE